MENQKENKGVIISIFIIVLVVVVFVYIIMNTKKVDENLPEDNTSMGQVTVNVTDATTLTEGELLPSTNQMEQISKNGDVLVMNYTGRFVDGKAFDSNIDPAFGHVQPFEFTLGAGMVIKGWDEGLVGMKVGEKRTLTVPPEKAYGPNDYAGIPGNSTLVFEVELTGIK
ncbi:MAG: FKBP-type peptidyl-prolyl cis-trans isomerase [Candidatus Pacebacteria bacterium]|nr:FKBP-type peptidyl-prolyl cis-trans isomerase [Candidatus Paceibacterota bacterium]